MSRKKSQTDKNTLGGRLESVIESKGLTRRQVFELTGVRPNYLSEIIRGVKTPSKRVLQVVSLRLSINEHWLKTGEGEMTANAPLVQPGMSTEQQQAYPTPTGSMGPLVAKAVEVLESDDQMLVGALSQSIEALHRALKDSRKVRKLPGKGPKPGQEAAGDGAAKEK